MNLRIARASAEALAQRGGNAIPVPVEDLAGMLGLRVLYRDLDPDLSGALVVGPRESYILVQQRDSENRQRFTIAHEIGHHCLGHQFARGEHVHVDHGHHISLRGPRAAAGLDAKEIEANQFAASLLMPAVAVRAHADQLGGPPLRDRAVSELAERFAVSEQAMTIRLDVLGLL
jgi:Zn-dependent peptidase ImmA (M78 family)